MQLLDDLRAILDQVETEARVHLSDADLADGREEILHVFLHEACHGALANQSPWVHDLPEEQHTAVDEIVARLLEEQVGLHLGMHIHTPEEHVWELAMYPVQLTVDQYEELRSAWQQRYSPEKDLAGMASYVLHYLFP